MASSEGPLETLRKITIFPNCPQWEKYRGEILASLSLKSFIEFFNSLDGVGI